MHLGDLDLLGNELAHLKSENNIGRDSRNKKNNQFSRSRYSPNGSYSRVTDLDLLDNERLNLKLTEKNKDYELLYAKFLSLENQNHNLEEANEQLLRQQKMLEQRISDFEIHTEGDEIVGELQNKLVLMSTEVMRLGNLSRSKTQQTLELNNRIKELLVRNEHLEKEAIEKEKILLNYKEELRLVEMRFNDMAEQQTKAKEDKQQKEKITKLIKQHERVTTLYKEKLQQLKNSEIKNAILEEKNQRLNQELTELENENKSLAANFSKSKNNNTTILNLEAEIAFLKQNNLSLKDEIKRLQQKMAQQRIEVEQQDRAKEEQRSFQNQLASQLNYAQEQLRKINLQYEELQNENKAIKYQQEEIIITKNEQLKKTEEKLALFEMEYQRQSRVKSELPKFEELIKEIQKLENIELTLKLQISNYEEKLAMLAQENERLSLTSQQHSQLDSTLRKVKSELQQKQKKLKEVQRELQNSNNRQKRYREDSDILRNKIKELSGQERNADTAEFKNRQLNDQIQALRTQINLKEATINQLNEKYERECVEKNSLARINEELNSKITVNYPTGDSPSFAYLQSELKKQQELRQRDAAKMQQLQQKNQEHEDIYTTFSGEIMRLNEVLASNNEKITNYKKQIDFLQHKVKSCEELLQNRKVMTFGSEKSIVDGESKSKIQICEGKIRGYESELELLKQHCAKMKEINFTQESKLNDLTREKTRLETKNGELEYQLTLKNENFRSVEDSFKLTIVEIKHSNERLEQSLKQIENHYISKLESKQQEILSLRRQKKQQQNTLHSLQKKMSNLQLTHDNELNEKNKFINSLNSNQKQTQEEIEAIKKLKGNYEIKIALLSQQIERQHLLQDQLNNEIDMLRKQLRQNESKYVQSMKDSSYNSQTVETLSGQIERLNNVVLKNIEQIKQQQKKINNLQRQNTETAKQSKEYQTKYQQLNLKANEDRNNLELITKKYEQAISQLRYQLQDKTTELQRNSQRLKQFQQLQQTETTTHMKTISEQMKLLRQSNQNLQRKLTLITGEYEQLAQQLQHYKRQKSYSDQDQKQKIINNYQNTITHLKEEHNKTVNEKNNTQMALERMNRLNAETQEKYNITLEKAKTYQEKSRRLEERNKIIEERIRTQEEQLAVKFNNQNNTESKLMNAMEEIGRLQLIIKTKDQELSNIQTLLKSQNYYSQDNLQQTQGIFVIKEASEIEERSRSASGNNQQLQPRQHNNTQLSDLQHRYDLLESVNKKISTEMECLRKKNVEYEFKMNKLKEEFDLINRLIHQYREENEKLKETNKLLSQGHSRSNNLMTLHSQYSSPQHSAVKNNSHFESAQKMANNQSSVSQRSNIVQSYSKIDKEESFHFIKSKLMDEIDRLTKVNSTLQEQVHDLRLNSSENISLKKRYEENLSLLFLLFTEVESLRGRVRQNEHASSFSPRK